jgi:hypothetical protein
LVANGRVDGDKGRWPPIAAMVVEVVEDVLDVVVDSGTVR